MTNLYARLVMGEDDRTEALADLLERLLADDRQQAARRFADFISAILLGGATDLSAKEAFLRLVNGTPNSISVTTQLQIADGTIPDLVILSGSDPICVVEVKIDASIGERQLEGYGTWLNDQAGDRYEPALVLLTESTDAPGEFRGPGERGYGVGLRSVAYWHDVADWFGILGRAEDSVGEPLSTLAHEFSEFLREGAMATLDDAAMARLYLAESKRKVTEAVGSMQVGYPFPDHWAAGRGVYEQAVGIWKYHYPEEDRNTRFLYCGLCFNPADKNDGALHGYTRYENDSADDPTPVVIGDGLYAFVCIDTPAEDCAYIPGFANSRWFERRGGVLVPSEAGPSLDTTGWWHYSSGAGGRSGYARIRALQDLLDDDGRMGARLKEWTHGALSYAVQFWVSTAA